MNQTRQARLVDPQLQRAADQCGFVVLGKLASGDHEPDQFSEIKADNGTKPRERRSTAVTDGHDATSTWATACQRSAIHATQRAWLACHLLKWRVLPGDCKTAGGTRRRLGRRGSRRTACQCHYGLTELSAAFAARIWPAQITA